MVFDTSRDDDDDAVSADLPVKWETLRPPQLHLYTWMRSADRRFTKNFGRLLKKVKLIASEWTALRELYRPGAESPMALTQILGMSKGGASKLVGRLVKKGLVVRQRSEFDRRFKSVFLTQQGRKLVAFMAPLEKAADFEFFGSLGNTRRHRLTEWLKHVLGGHRSQHMNRWVSTQLKQNAFPEIDPNARAKEVARKNAEYDAFCDFLERTAEAAAYGTTPPSWDEFCKAHPRADA